MSLMFDDVMSLVGDSEAPVRLRYGKVIAIEGSTVVVAAKTGGTVYAAKYAYCEVGDIVCLMSDGANCMAFAAKDAARIESDIKEAGMKVIPTMSETTAGVARVGSGLHMDGDVLTVSDIPSSFIAGL